MGDPSRATPTRETLTQITTALRAAHPALAALGVEGRAALLEASARRWLAEPPEAALDACAHASGYSARMLRWGLNETLSRWLADAFVGALRAEVPHFEACDEALLASPPRVCGQILASTTPPASLEAIAQPLLLGSSVLVRPSAAVAPLVLAWIEALPEPLRAAVAAVEFPSTDDALCEALARRVDHLVVHGRDATIARWGRLLPARTPLLARSHRVSVAYLSAEVSRRPDALREALEGFALDLCAWDQSGCLSPVALFVEARDDAPDAEAIAAQLVEHALPPVEARLPTAGWPVEVVAARAHFIRTQLFDATLHESSTAAVLVHDTPIFPETSMLHRVLPLVPVPDEAALVALLSASPLRLQGLGVAGDAETRARLAGALARTGVSRVCGPGRLQRPPLTWRQDGVGVFAPLLRWVAIEK